MTLHLSPVNPCTRIRVKTVTDTLEPTDELKRPEVEGENILH